MISLQDGSVKALVGGERDPMNLFAYGDVDGKGVDAKLQHPLGVAMFGEDQVAVADSYNHKVKLINPSTKTCTTILGQGEPGNRCGSATDAAFNEPGGLALDPTGQYLYIADTNNHSIKVYDLSTKEVAEFPVIFPTLTELDCTDSLPQPVFKRLTPARAELVTLEQLNLLEGQLLLCHLNIQLPEHWHLTEGAPSAWQIWLEDDVTECESPAKGSLTDLVHQPWLEFRGRRTGKTDIKLECMLYYCDDIGTCRMKGLVFVQPVVIFKRDAHPSTESVQSDFTYLVQ
ncbi:NHL repeat-containing protein 2-like [Lingula anatina]|uniref:NHL repeat-containing protein 2-like n=1 Tax=Lingula anatina TaxID=7574 RepID=A0A1S3IX12_LINAN|nr:NHL repeat-containing protein 2-like [Lingula anatina]|eukprot:XP_013402084.1 NHL repeat-containing protein 2-like [Lingula anatina]